MFSLQGATIKRHEITGDILVARVIHGGLVERSGKLGWHCVSQTQGTLDSMFFPEARSLFLHLGQGLQMSLCLARAVKETRNKCFKRLQHPCPESPYKGCILVNILKATKLSKHYHDILQIEELGLTEEE